MPKSTRKNAAEGRIVRSLGAPKETFEAFDKAAEAYCPHGSVALARLLEWFASRPENEKRDILAPLLGGPHGAAGPASKERRAG